MIRHHFTSRFTACIGFGVCALCCVSAILAEAGGTATRATGPDWMVYSNRVSTGIGVIVTGSPTGFAYTDEELREHRCAALLREHRPDDSAINAQLDRTLPELSLDAVSLSDVVEFLQDVSGANFLIDWDQLKANGFDKKTPVTLRVRNITFRKSLDRISAQLATPKARLIFSPALECIAIVAVPVGAGEGNAPEPQALSQQSTERLDRELPVFRFVSSPLSQAIASLAKEAEVRIIVNWRGLEREGVQRDTPVTVELKDARISRWLQTICDLVSNERRAIRFTIDQGIVTISTSFESRLQPFERRYNLHELLGGLRPDASAAREAAILNLITNTIAPATWFPEGKNPNIRIEAEHLIVIQPDAIQRQIPELLTQLWLLGNSGLNHSPDSPK